MMKKLHILSIAALTGALLLPAVKTVNAASPVDGLWLTENKRSVIRVAPCEQGLCGHIHWIIEGGMQSDAKNPDASKRDRPMCGLPILWGFKQDSETAWEDGKIYKADDGDVYDANLALQNDGTLKVRGYMGISLLGKSQIWTRVDEAEYPACE